MEKSAKASPRRRIFTIIPALPAAAALVAAALALAGSRSGRDFKQACMAVPMGVPWQEASKGLVESGGTVTGWGGPTGGPILNRDWGRGAFPLRRLRCDLTLDESGLVTGAEYVWWFKYGPGHYTTARIKKVLGMQSR